MYIVLSGIAVLVILTLSLYAVLLLRRVKALEARQLSERAEQEAKYAEQRQQKNRSIQILAQGVLTDQLTLTEASIRIRGLLEGLGVTDEAREEFNAFYQLAEVTSHIPILEEWKKLKTKQRLAFDNERTRLETDHKEFVEDAARRILGRDF